VSEIGRRYQRESVYRSGGPIPSPPRGAEAAGERGRPIALPQPDPNLGDARLWHCIAQRRSERQFTGEPIPLEQLALLLWVSGGRSELLPGGGAVPARPGRVRRTAPSAGATYPLETYCVCFYVDGLQPGLYHYSVDRHDLTLVRSGDLSAEVADVSMGQKWVRRAAAVLAWPAVFPRTEARYKDRALRYIYLDAGHYCQNLYLAATALGLGCCAIGAYSDEAADALLGLGGDPDTTVVYMGAVGRLA